LKIVFYLKKQKYLTDKTIDKIHTKFFDHFYQKERTVIVQKETQGEVYTESVYTESLDHHPLKPKMNGERLNGNKINLGKK